LGSPCENILMELDLALPPFELFDLYHKAKFEVKLEETDLSPSEKAVTSA